MSKKTKLKDEFKMGFGITPTLVFIPDLIGDPEEY